MPSIPALPAPGRVVTAAGSQVHKVLSTGISVASSGLTVAQSVVDRIPGAEHAGAADIGVNPKRRHGSAASRSLAR